MPSPPFKKSSKPRDGFDTAAFIDSVAADLNGEVRGYAVFLRGKAGTIVGKATYGYARAPGEDRGEQAFNGRTKTAWGSVTKMITTAAVIDKTERSVNRHLDEKMVDFLPERWRSDVHPGHREVTIGHLLSYRSGFRQKPPDDISNPEDLFARLKREPEREVGGNRGYSNESFSIFHYMGRFFRLGRWDEIEAAYSPGEIDYDSYVFGHGVAIYQNTVQKRIYKPLGIKARCNEVDFDDDNYALFYNNPDSAKGYFLNPQDKSGCATGGVVMSARDMGKFLHALTRTDQIVSRENHATLLAVSTDELCGWNGSNEMADSGLAFHKAGARTMNGTSIPGNTRTGKVGATIIAYPNGMSAVLVHNSGSSADKKRRAMLADAYSAGLG